MLYKFYSPIDSRNEWCYYIQSINPPEIDKLSIYFGELHPQTTLKGDVQEVGPRMSFKTSWSSNVSEILDRCRMCSITRVERSKRSNDKIIYDPMVEEIYHTPLTSFTSNIVPEPVRIVPKSDIEKFNQENNLGWDQQDVEFYSSLFDRDPTNIELLDLAQSNSEHSRHTFFNGKHIIGGVEKPTLFNLIKSTLPPNTNSVLAFCDNASAIKGYKVQELIPIAPIRASAYTRNETLYHPTFTAETHNFPTGIAPFPGASTGVGGRIRDTLAIGRGGKMVAGTVGYCVADDNLLVQASNGASDYGNKIGEPQIQGFTRYFDQTVCGERWAWIKPIMFSGGVGMVADQNLLKGEPKCGMDIVRIGGPALRIGMGGSTASSQHQEADNFNAVQRGDPEMENRVYAAIASLTEMNNPIISIHDQGAGGTANVTKEIVEPVGGNVYIDNIINGDDTLTTVEKWIAEYQEQMTMLIDPLDLPIVHAISERENIDTTVFGHVSNDGYIRVHDGDTTPVNLNLTKIFKPPQKIYIDRKIPKIHPPLILPRVNFVHILKKVFALESVGSKRFLTNKVDRSVGGLVVQQQCCGPLQTPVSDYAVVAHSWEGFTGTVTSIGEQPIKALYDPGKSGELAVAEAITSLMFCHTSLSDIKCSVNWMWPAKLPGENATIYECMEHLVDYMKCLGVSADGGKDSVSMYTRQGNELVKSPRSVVVSAYTTTADFRIRVTPDLKKDSYLIHIPICKKVCLGGSAFTQAMRLGGGKIHAPPAEDLKKIFDIVQHLLGEGLINSGHDVSDGGLITTITEMAISGNVGVTITTNGLHPVPYFFSEASGVVIGIDKGCITDVCNALKDVEYTILGHTNENKKFELIHNGNQLVVVPLGEIRGWWEALTVKYEALQCAESNTAEWDYLVKGNVKEWRWHGDIDILPHGPKVAVLREEGSNGSREMAGAFYRAGFEVWDLTMTDLLKDPRLLDQFVGIAFVGGFSFADALGAGVGWSRQILDNLEIMTAFEKFKNRPDTFSIGVCNGCQLMSHIGWIPQCKFVENNSKRFESRLSTVTVKKNNSIMLQNLEGTVFGIWVAHGEGRYIGDGTGAVMNFGNGYPENPNGSIDGICGVVSDDGRHLAMMPHPERCWLSWQMPWLPDNYDCEYTPWFKMFVNARHWVK